MHKTHRMLFRQVSTTTNWWCQQPVMRTFQMEYMEQETFTMIARASCFSPFHPSPWQIGRTALCQMGGPATVQALRGLVFVWPTSSLPLSLIPCYHIQTHGIRLESQQGGSTAILMVRPPSWGRWGLEVLAGWRQVGVGTMAWPLCIPKHQLSVIYLYQYPHTMELIYYWIIATVSGMSTVCVTPHSGFM